MGWVLALVSAPVSTRAAFVNFESGHVRPLALSPDGTRLFAVNTPDNRLTIYDVTAGGAGLSLAAEVPVGLEPVAVAVRVNLSNRTEVWVVNHLSDSVSIVEIDPSNATLSRVTHTLLVGDEPRDIVFAGSGGNRAFVTCARRGQNRFPTNPDTGPQLTTSGTGRADVWAFNADALGADPLRGTPLSIIQLFGDTPRALAAAPGGSVVYAAVFESGNRTTTINEGTVNGAGPPPPAGSTPGAPAVGLIVKFDGTTWKDERAGSNWNGSVPFALPDQDVFVIDADANPPALFPTNNVVTGVGTIIFNMITRPSNGKLFVSNTEAQNQVRFEPMVSGHLHESRITVVTGTAPAPRPLNLIDYGTPTGPQSEIDQSIAFPLAMAFSTDPTNSLLFVPGFGSRQVGVYDADDLENGIITKSLVQVGSGATGGGPTGVVFDGAFNRLYVMNRFDQAVSVVSNANNAGRAQTALVPLRYDPSPPVVRNGRRFLYDARKSGHGDSACASCHVFGDFDSLAWDLGDPFGSVVANPNPFRLDVNGPPGNPFHPLKGPMTTQSLRGLAGAGPMHWRGDRTGGTMGGDPLDETLAFKAFNPAFVGLLGATSQLSAADMQAFTDFILTVQYPPNPIRNLDSTLTAQQATGQTEMQSSGRDAGQPCTFCHALPLGTDGFSSFEGETQEFKIAHQRNLYQKVGMFGVPGGVPGIPGTGNLGNQVRGFGFLHDGSIATVFDFLQADVFSFTNGNTSRRAVEAFLMTFDTGLKPSVGQQVTVTQANFADSTVTARINLLIARDEANECDLVVKGNLAGEARGWVYDDVSNAFRSDRASEGLVSEVTLRTQAGTGGQERTYTCVPPGNGTRIGIDRDEDGFLDRTELDAGADPANPASIPGATTTTTSTSTSSSASSSSSTSSSSTSTSRSTTSSSSSSTSTAPPTTTSSSATSSTSTSSSSSSSSSTSTTSTVPTSTGTVTSTSTSTTATSTSSSVTNTGLSTTTVTTSSVTSTTSSTSTSSTSTTSTSTSSTTTTTLVRIPARALILKDRTVPTPNPSLRRIACKVDTRLSPFANRVFPPQPGGPDDPRTGGATLTVYNASSAPGHPTDVVTVALAAANWKAIGSSSISGYRYTGPDANGPIGSVVLKSDSLSVRGGKVNWTYTLDEPSQGRVGVRLTLADGAGWCADVPAKLAGNPPSTAATDKRDKFIGQPNAPAPASCPALP